MHTPPDWMLGVSIFEMYHIFIYDLHVIFTSVDTGHIGEDFDADLQDGLLTSKVYFLIKSLLEYR